MFAGLDWGLSALLGFTSHMTVSNSYLHFQEVEFDEHKSSYIPSNFSHNQNMMPTTIL